MHNHDNNVARMRGSRIEVTVHIDLLWVGGMSFWCGCGMWWGGYVGCTCLCSVVIMLSLDHHLLLSFMRLRVYLCGRPTGTVIILCVCVRGSGVFLHVLLYVSCAVIICCVTKITRATTR